MGKVADYLKEAQTFYLATVEGDVPKLRPFGAATEIKGRTYLATSNDKKVFEQLKRNPKLEVVAVLKGNWIRVTGKAVFDDSVEVKAAMLDANPFLKIRYSAADGKLALFYIDSMKAFLCGFSGEAVEVDDTGAQGAHSFKKEQAVYEER